MSSAKPMGGTKPATGRYSALELRNTAGLDVHGMDSLSATLFANYRKTIKENPPKNVPPTMAKKTKDDSEKMEELQMGYEAMKNHLKAAFDDIERLKNENNTLRVRREVDSSQPQVVFRLLPTNHEQGDEQNDQEESDNELEATI